MSLNCVPGDLARVISTPDTRECGTADWFVTVTRLNGVTNEGNLPAWGYEGPLRKITQGVWKGCIVECICDHILRPIRDPGPDAVDETLLTAPVTNVWDYA